MPGKAKKSQTEPSERYVFIPESTMISERYKDLSPHAKTLYNYLILKRAGRNKSFAYSYKDIREDTGLTNDMIAKGNRELVDGKFMRYRHGGLEVNQNVYYLYPRWLKRREKK